jgi:hypothetical protein
MPSTSSCSRTTSQKKSDSHHNSERNYQTFWGLFNSGIVVTIPLSIASLPPQR